ncbi:hypothetical protein COV20_02315 [Candidatus Woesearchaeota archaeon CG10_big_fil_rev_8_21_14_0_10_45_16]|nr:MAG: hypothetical protein COV20_02315 [Candidatus Woesearchaeota archaeon CG10_big_fil_rev_8_21_14_0_10_45_16]
MIQFSVEKCKTKAAYSAKLKKKQKLDLNKIKKQFTVLLDTPILLVIKEEGLEIIVHGYGELLFKNSQDIKLMEKIARKVYEVGLEK